MRCPQPVRTPIVRDTLVLALSPDPSYRLFSAFSSDGSTVGVDVLPNGATGEATSSSFAASYSHSIKGPGAKIRGVSLSLCYAYAVLADGTFAAGAMKNETQAAGMSMAHFPVVCTRLIPSCVAGARRFRGGAGGAPVASRVYNPGRFFRP